MKPFNKNVSKRIVSCFLAATMVLTNTIPTSVFAENISDTSTSHTTTQTAIDDNSKNDDDTSIAVASENNDDNFKEQTYYELFSQEQQDEISKNIAERKQSGTVDCDPVIENVDVNPIRNEVTPVPDPFDDSINLASEVKYLIGEGSESPDSLRKQIVNKTDFSKQYAYGSYDCTIWIKNIINQVIGVKEPAEKAIKAGSVTFTQDQGYGFTTAAIALGYVNVHYIPAKSTTDSKGNVTYSWNSEQVKDLTPKYSTKKTKANRQIFDILLYNKKTTWTGGKTEHAALYFGSFENGDAVRQYLYNIGAYKEGSLHKKTSGTTKYYVDDNGYTVIVDYKGGGKGWRIHNTSATKYGKGTKGVRIDNMVKGGLSDKEASLKFTYRPFNIPSESRSFNLVKYDAIAYEPVFQTETEVKNKPTYYGIYTKNSNGVYTLATIYKDSKLTDKDEDSLVKIHEDGTSDIRYVADDDTEYYAIEYNGTGGNVPTGFTYNGNAILIDFDGDTEVEQDVDEYPLPVTINLSKYDDYINTTVKNKDPFTFVAFSDYNEALLAAQKAAQGEDFNAALYSSISIGYDTLQDALNEENAKQLILNTDTNGLATKTFWPSYGNVSYGINGETWDESDNPLVVNRDDAENPIYRYYVVEVHTPEGFSLPSVANNVISVNATYGNMTINSARPDTSVPNYQANGIKLSIHKDDGITGDATTGATYELYTDADCTQRAKDKYGNALRAQTTDNSGDAIWGPFFPNAENIESYNANGYPIFRYYAKEIDTTAGSEASYLDINPTVYTATAIYLNRAGTGLADSTDTVNVGVFKSTSGESAKDYGHIRASIKKTDGNLIGGSNNPLYVSNATYTLYKDANCTQPITYNYPSYITNANDYVTHTGDVASNYHANRNDVVTMTTKSDGSVTYSGWFYPTNDMKYSKNGNNVTWTVYAKETAKSGEAQNRDLNPTIYFTSMDYDGTGVIADKASQTISTHDYGWVRVTIKKNDKESKKSLNNAKFEIYEDSACTVPVKYNYPSYLTSGNYTQLGLKGSYHANNPKVDLTSGTDGIAISDSFYPSFTAECEIRDVNGMKLPYYTYYVKEIYAPSLYYVEKNLNKVNIVHKMKAVTYQETATTETNGLLNADTSTTNPDNEKYFQNAMNAENFAVKGWLELFKEDAQLNGYTKYSFLNSKLLKNTSGTAQFAGSVYELRAAETIYHPDGQTTGSDMGISNSTTPGVLFNKSDLIKSAEIDYYHSDGTPHYNVVNSTGRYSTNEKGYLQIGSSNYDKRDAEDLWIGKYTLKEVPVKTFTKKSQVSNTTQTINLNANGYLIDPTTYDVTVAYEGQDVKKVKATVSPNRFTNSTNIVIDGPNGTPNGNKTLLVSPEQVVTQKFSLIKVKAEKDATNDAERYNGIGFYVKSRLDLGRYVKTNANGEFLDANGKVTTDPSQYQVLYKRDSFGTIQYDKVYQLFELENYNENERITEVDGLGKTAMANVKVDKNGNPVPVTDNTLNKDTVISEMVQIYLDENPKLVLDQSGYGTISINNGKHPENEISGLANCKIVKDTDGTYWLALPQYNYTDNASPNRSEKIKIDTKSDKYGQYEYWNEAINYGPDMVTTTTVDGNVVEKLKPNYMSINSRPSKTGDYDSTGSDASGVLYSIPLPYGLYAVEESVDDAEDKGLVAAASFDFTINDDTLSKYGAYENNAYARLEGNGIGTVPFRVVEDGNWEFFLQVAKRDSESGQLVLMPGASYKIYKIEYEEVNGRQIRTEKLIKHKAYVNSTVKYTTVWTTDRSGRVFLNYQNTDVKFPAGEYIIKEVKTPALYYLCNSNFTEKYVSPDFMRLNFYKETEENGITFTIDNDDVFEFSFKPKTVQAVEDADSDIIVTVDDYNQPVKGRITVEKNGPFLTRYENTFRGPKTWVTFKYEEQSLPGAVYQIIPNETIYTEDHQYDWNKVQNKVPDWTVDITVESMDTDPVTTTYKYSEITYDEFIQYALPDLFDEELAEIEDCRVVAVVNGSKGSVQAEAGAVVDEITTGYNKLTVYDKYLRDNITINRGQAISTNLPLGTYKVVEIQAPNGCVLPENEEDRTNIVTLEYAGQNVPLVRESTNFHNDRQKVDLKVKKYDIETEEPVEGAEFTLYSGERGIYNTEDTKDPLRKLIFAKNQTIEAENTDSDGMLTFSAGSEKYNTQLDNDTLPHGSYYGRETKRPFGYYSLSENVQSTIKYDAYWTTQNQTIPTLEYQVDVPEIQTIVRFQKVDYYTNVPLSGAVLQVIRPELDENGEYVLDENGKVQGEVIDTWETKADETYTWKYNGKTYDGHVIRGLNVGDTYILREIQAPDNYVNIEKSLQECKDANEGYNETYKDIFFTVEDCTYDENGVINSPVQTIVMKDDHIKGKILINKTGEVLTGVTEIEAFNIIENLIHYVFNYNVAALESVEYEITAASDIKHPDGVSEDFYKAGDKVATITTDIFGIAITDELPLGDYNIKEVKTADGYVVNNDVDTVTLSEENQWIRVVNAKKHYENIRQKVDISIIKKSSVEAENKYVNSEAEKVTEDKVLSGAIFGLYAADDITGYTMKDPQTVSYSLDPQNKTVLEETVNVAEKSDDVLLAKDSLIETAVTDSNGVAHFTSELPLGTYYVKEIQAPAGYHTSFEKVTFDCTYQGQDVDVIEYTHEVYDTPTVIEVSKLIKEAEGKESVATTDYNVGAKLQIIDNNGKVMDEWVTDGGVHYTKHLVIGQTYTLVEVNPAPGYVTADPIKFTVEDYTISKVNNETEKLVNIEKTDNVEISTTAKEGQSNLDEGAVDTAIAMKPYNLVDKDGNKFEDFNGITFENYCVFNNEEKNIDTTTVEDGVLKMVTLGIKTDYTLKAVNSDDDKDVSDLSIKFKDFNGFAEKATLLINWPSQGYNNVEVQMEKPNIIINIPDKVVVDDISDGRVITEVQPVTMYDDHTRLHIKKTDITTSAEIPGATLQIINADTNEVYEEWVSTTEEHVIEYIPIGNYLLREIQAPTENGYVKAEDVYFTVEDTGIVQNVEMKDDYTKLTISKTDIATSEELEGAKLQIIDENGNIFDEWISTKDKHYIEYIPVGSYILREITAPNGYVTAEDIRFTVEETGVVQKVEMKDDYTKVQISKQDITTKEELPGAKLKIVDSEGKVVDEWTSTNEVHYIEYLPAGEYTLIEKTAPKGYTVAEEIKFTVEDTGAIQTVVMYDKPITKNKVKTGDENNYMIYLFIGFACGACAYVLNKKKKRKDDTEGDE